MQVMYLTYITGQLPSKGASSSYGELMVQSVQYLEDTSVATEMKAFVVQHVP